MPADSLASSNVVWYDIGVPGILTVSMDNITYLYQFRITDSISLQAYIAIYSFHTFGTEAHLNNNLSIMGPQPKFMIINYHSRDFAS